MWVTMPALCRSVIRIGASTLQKTHADVARCGNGPIETTTSKHVSAVALSLALAVVLHEYVYLNMI